VRSPDVVRPLAVWALAVVVVAGLFVLAGGSDAMWSDRVDASWPTGAVVAVVIGLLAADALVPIPSTAVLAASGAVLGAPLGAFANVVGLLAGFAVAMELGRRLRRSPAAPGAPAAPVALGRGHVAAIAATRGVPVLNEAVAATAGHLGVDRSAASSAAAVGAVPVGIAYAVAADQLRVGVAGAVAVAAAVGAVQLAVLLAS
jgi:uncharacterized membrane protein YdjX (TVP38/TMEM64 family)